MFPGLTTPLGAWARTSPREHGWDSTLKETTTMSTSTAKKTLKVNGGAMNPSTRSSEAREVSLSTVILTRKWSSFAMRYVG